MFSLLTYFEKQAGQFLSFLSYADIVNVSQITFFF